MSQPVKLSDSLVLDARLVGDAAERSIAGQIEFWAGLGRAVERLLRTPDVLALRGAGQAQPLSDCLAAIGAEAGRRLLDEHLAHRPFPHYETAPGKPGFLVRVDEDGTRTVGRFVKRVFVPARKAPRSRSRAA